MSLLPQIQLIFISFFSSFFFSFIFVYIYKCYLLLFVKFIKYVGVLLSFFLFTYIYFKLCLFVYDGEFSMYQILFLFLGVVYFYKVYYLYFNRLVVRIMNRNHKSIEKLKNTLYNHFKKMGGIIRGRSRKKRKENCADN